MIEICDVAVRGMAAVRARLGPNDVVGIIGPSGSGRTTLLEAIAGARRHLGKVRIHGRARRRDQVALAPEEPEQILFGETAAQAVLGGPGRQALTALGGDGLLERDWQRLSTGERRRVALAAVLGRGAKLLLFDKPTAGLDPDGAERFWEALRATGKPAVVVANDRAEAARCSSWLMLPAGGAAVPAGQIMPYGMPGCEWPPDERALTGWVLAGRSPTLDTDLIEEVRRWKGSMAPRP